MSPFFSYQVKSPFPYVSAFKIFKLIETCVVFQHTVQRCTVKKGTNEKVKASEVAKGESYRSFAIDYFQGADVMGGPHRDKIWNIFFTKKSKYL